MSETTITIATRPNGPLLVSGRVKLIDSTGTEFDLGGRETIALCRCGQSANRPFCDGAHKACGFLADEKATAVG